MKVTLPLVMERNINIFYFFGFSQRASLRKCSSVTVGQTRMMLSIKERKKLRERSDFMIHASWRIVWKRRESHVGWISTALHKYILFLRRPSAATDNVIKVNVTDFIAHTDGSCGGWMFTDICLW